MLRKLQTREFQELSEFVYDLSLDLSRTSFPVYTDGIKTKQQFLKRSEDGLHRSDEEVLIFEKDGNTEGWIHYYVIPADKYLGICSMSIRSGYAEAFDELLAYWKEKYPQHRFSLYFPEENHEIMDYMPAHGFQDRSQEVVDVLLFRNYELQHESKNVTRIGILMYFGKSMGNMRMGCTGTVIASRKESITGRFSHTNSRDAVWEQFTTTAFIMLIVKSLDWTYLRTVTKLLLQKRF